MKNKNLIAMFALPIVILLLLLPVIPHHHHEGEVCTTIEYCNHDHRANDAHTHHHGDTSTCVVESHFFLTKSHTASQTLSVKQILLFVGTISSFVLSHKDLSSSKAVYRYASFYKSIGLYNHRSLRAPPFEKVKK